MSETPQKAITFDELKKHVSRDDFYVLLHNKVYNVTQFLDEHPGGDEVIMAEAGKDATDAFEDVGHSDEARALLEGLFIADLEKDGTLKTKDAPPPVPAAPSPAQKSSAAISYLVPLAFLGAYLGWRYYSSS